MHRCSMSRKVGTVKIERPYHHGDLRAALMDAAEQVLVESGPEAFSVREIARRAGVSPAAPKHHFKDVQALRTAIATRAFVDLASRLEAVVELGGGDRRARIRTQGAAYIEFALANPERFTLMFRAAMLDKSDRELRAASTRAFRALDALVRGKNSTALPEGDPGLATTIACWSIAHGFAHLALDGHFGAGVAARDRAVKGLLPRVLALLAT